MAMLVNRAARNEQVAQRFGIGYQPPPAESATNLTRSGLQRKRVAELENGVSNAARLVHLRTLSMQGLWARWDNVAIVAAHVFRTHLSGGAQVLVNSMLLTLPSEDNKRRWFNKPAASSRCVVVHPVSGNDCGKVHPTAMHVLTGCGAALQQGRYTWRHNSVLLVLEEHLIRHVAEINEGRVLFSEGQAAAFSSRRRSVVQFWNSWNPSTGAGATV